MAGFEARENEEEPGPESSMQRYFIERTSVNCLAQTSTKVWEHITSWEGVNAELWPFNMTHPDSIPTIAHIPPDGQVHFVSNLRLGIPSRRPSSAELRGV